MNDLSASRRSAVEKGDAAFEMFSPSVWMIYEYVEYSINTYSVLIDAYKGNVDKISRPIREIYKTPRIYSSLDCNLNTFCKNIINHFSKPELFKTKLVKGDRLGLLNILNGRVPENETYIMSFNEIKSKLMEAKW